MGAGALARRFVAPLRRASDALYRALVIVLLSLAYVVVIPWYALVLRLRRRRVAGWQVRHDPDVGALERLRSPF